MKYRKKSVEVDVITWDEFIEYGLNHTDNIVEGMPWSFEYKDHPITHENDQCYIIPTLEGFMRFTPEDVLITGVKGEIYPCKKDIFEETYEEIDKEERSTGMNFGEAIKLVRHGRRLQRSGWNGKSQYIELATNISYVNANGTVVNCEHDAIGNKAIAFVGTSGVQLGWLASQADMLADDWMIVGGGR